MGDIVKMGVIVAFVIFIIIVIIRFAKVYRSDIYKACLYSITSSINVDLKASKSSNIVRNGVSVMYILVRRTMSNKYFREVITGKLIPISYTTAFSYELRNYRHCVYVPLFLQSNFVYKGIYKASDEDIDKYIDRIKFIYRDFKSFRIYLDNLFTEGKKYYKDSEAKAKVHRLEKRKELSKRRKFIKEIKL